VIATGFMLLLTRWASGTDVCIMSSHSHRIRPGSEAVIGDFVTPYPLRMRFKESTTLEDTVRQCQEAVLVHREHGQVAPTSTLAQWPEWSRYNLNYLIAADAVDIIDMGAVKLERLEWDVLERRTLHDLGLFVRQSERGVHGGFGYNAERFSVDLARRAAARLGQLLHTIATTPTDRVRDLRDVP
jgi:hypothetical protein